MPYSNIPKSKWPEMERCVSKVRAKGNVDNPYAVCYSSVMGENDGKGGGGKKSKKRNLLVGIVKNAKKK